MSKLQNHQKQRKQRKTVNVMMAKYKFAQVQQDCLNVKAIVDYMLEKFPLDRRPSDTCVTMAHRLFDELRKRRDVHGKIEAHEEGDEHEENEGEHGEVPVGSGCEEAKEGEDDPLVTADGSNTIKED